MPDSTKESSPSPVSPFRIKKAVLIGIQYKDHLPEELQLERCHKDVDIMYNLLQDNGYDKGNILVLRDRPLCQPEHYPSEANIRKAMEWLVKDATPHHTLIFYFAGHGRQIEDTNGDEDDGLDEAIVPAEDGVQVAPLKQTFTSKLGRGLRRLRKLSRSTPLKGPVILDDEMRDIMCVGLPRGCRLRGIFDMCHSGTPLDLDHVFTAAKLKQVSPRWMNSRRPLSLLLAVSQRLWCLYNWFTRVLRYLRILRLPRSRAGPAAELAKPGIDADVVSLGACADAQHSYDDTSLAEVLRHAYDVFDNVTWRQLLVFVDNKLRSDSDNAQVPTLSSSNHLDWDAETCLID